MARPAAQRDDAVQPSLWDRLVNDLPGLRAEAEALRGDLTKLLGDGEMVAEIVAQGRPALRRQSELSQEAHTGFDKLFRVLERARVLAERSVVVTPEVLREAVRRDVEALFNTERLEAHYLLTDEELESHEAPADLLADFPEVRSSVLNFGVPAFSGTKGASIDREGYAREVRDALRAFEPRLKPDSIRVRVAKAERAGIKVTVDAILMMTPVEERLRLSTTINLDNGQATTTGEVR